MLSATTVHINDQTLALLSGVVIPLAVGAVTKITASRRLQDILNALLSAIAGAVTTAVQAKGNIVSQTCLLNIGIAWVSSVATYYGLWEPPGWRAASRPSPPTSASGPHCPPPKEPPCHRPRTPAWGAYRPDPRDRNYLMSRKLTATAPTGHACGPPPISTTKARPRPARATAPRPP